MHSRQFYPRTIRLRTGTPVIVIPAPIAKKFGFHIGKLIENGKLVPRILNSQGEKAFVYSWLDCDNNIEIQETLRPLVNTNGVISKDYLKKHGGSCEFSIPWGVKQTFEFLNLKLNEVKITVKDHIIEIIPLK